MDTHKPVVTSQKRVEERSGYQAVQAPRRPAFADVDLDKSQRPGRLRARDLKPFPNTSFPPERQAGASAVPMHNRPNKNMPPVFGTSTPLKGLSGVVRRAAYGLPDHAPSHWLLMMLGDRVDSFETRAKRVLPVAIPAALIFWAMRRSS
jgi:hypothetical protein